MRKRVLFTNRVAFHAMVAFLIVIVLLSCAPALKRTPPSMAAESFVPFKHISRIAPGKTKLGKAISLFGQPESEEITKERVSVGIKLGGNKIIHYKSRGLSLVISKENIGQPNPIIDAIWAEGPYAGRSPNGLFIGMSEKEALLICNHDYYPGSHALDNYFFAPRKGKKPTFQLWFEGERLIRIKIFRKS